jgi:hypothetical protein
MNAEDSLDFPLRINKYRNVKVFRKKSPPERDTNTLEWGRTVAELKKSNAILTNAVHILASRAGVEEHELREVMKTAEREHAKEAAAIMWIP